MEPEGSLPHSQLPALCEHLVTRYVFTPQSWRTTTCRLSATVYSIYSRLPSSSEAVPPSANLRTRRAVVTRTHLSQGLRTDIQFFLRHPDVL